MSDDLARTDRTRVRRKPERGSHDRELINTILDEGLVCHVGVAVDGQPRVIPTVYARAGDTLYLHGARGSQLLRALVAGVEACVTVTLLDGLVLARSAFHHSVNYRSVVVFGRTEPVEDPDEKLAATVAIVEHLVPGRAGGTRMPTEQELRTTLIARLPITEASAKVRAGGPIDDPEDMLLDHWAGVLPLGLAVGAPVPDGDGSTSPPAHVTDWRRPRG